MALGDPVSTLNPAGSLSPGSRGASRRGIAARYFPQGQTGQVYNAAQQSFDTYKTHFAPDTVAAQSAAARANANLGVNNSYYDYLRGNEQTNYDLAARGIGLQEAGLGIDRTANARDAAYYQNLLNLLGQERGLVGEDFNNTVARLTNETATNRRGVDSEATAAGAWLSSGRGNRQQDLTKNFETSRLQADIARRRAELGLTKEQYGLEKSKAETADRNAKLDLMGQQYGLDRAKLKAGLDQGLANLGYKEWMDTDALLDKLDSANLAEAQVARQIVDSAIKAGQSFNSGAMGDYYADLLGGK